MAPNSKPMLYFQKREKCATSSCDNGGDQDEQSKKDAVRRWWQVKREMEYRFTIRERSGRRCGRLMASGTVRPVTRFWRTSVAVNESGDQPPCFQYIANAAENTSKNSLEKEWQERVRT